jgi:hypothetical protein
MAEADEKVSKKTYTTTYTKGSWKGTTYGTGGHKSYAYADGFYGGYENWWEKHEDVDTPPDSKKNENGKSGSVIKVGGKPTEGSKNGCTVVSKSPLWADKVHTPAREVYDEDTDIDLMLDDIPPNPGISDQDALNLVRYNGETRCALCEYPVDACVCYKPRFGNE